MVESVVVVNRLQNVAPAPRYRRMEDVELTKIQEYAFLQKGSRKPLGTDGRPRRIIDVPVMEVPEAYMNMKFIPDALIKAVESISIPFALPEPDYVFTGLEHVDLLGFSDVRANALSPEKGVDRKLQELFLQLHDWVLRSVSEFGAEYFSSENPNWENFVILFRWSENIRLSYLFMNGENEDEEDDVKSDSYYYDFLKVFFFLLQNCGRDGSYWNMDAEKEAYKVFADQYGWEKELR